MKNISKTLGVVSSIVLIVAAVLLIGFIFGWVTSDDLQTGLGKTLAVAGVVVMTCLGLLGITSLLNKD